MSQKRNRNYIFKKKQEEIQKLKTTVTKMKILLGRLSRVEMAEESISELESRSIEIIQSEDREIKDERKMNENLRMKHYQAVQQVPVGGVL